MFDCCTCSLWSGIAWERDRSCAPLEGNRVRAGGDFCKPGKATTNDAQMSVSIYGYEGIRRTGEEGNCRFEGSRGGRGIHVMLDEEELSWSRGTCMNDACSSAVSLVISKTKSPTAPKWEPRTCPILGLRAESDLHLDHLDQTDLR